MRKYLKFKIEIKDLVTTNVLAKKEEEYVVPKENYDEFWASLKDFVKGVRQEAIKSASGLLTENRISITVADSDSNTNIAHFETMIGIPNISPIDLLDYPQVMSIKLKVYESLD